MMQGEILVQPSLAVLSANVERLTIGLGIRIVTCPKPSFKCYSLTWVVIGDRPREKPSQEKLVSGGEEKMG